MSSKIIIIAVVLMLIISFSVLYVVEAKNHDFDYQKSWNVIYFENPRDDSLDFVIENHEGEKMEYSYQILVDDKQIAEDKVEIEKGAKQEILPVLEMEKNVSAKITVAVSVKDLKYRIYKNIQ
jgi:hypothetical protein